MPRGRKKAVKKPVPPSANPVYEGHAKNLHDTGQESWVDQEVEKKIAAIRAIRDVEIDHLRMGLRLLRSYISKEQMESPAAQFFSENLPNVSVDREGQFEMNWKDDEDYPYFSNSLFRGLSLPFSDCSTAFPYHGGLDFTAKTVKTSFLNAANLQIRDFVLDEPLDSQMIGMQDTLRTPGLSNPMRLSVGTTPKTLRQPKLGEMLLSVHGSPLGVYQKEEMEPIHESEEP